MIKIRIFLRTIGTYIFSQNSWLFSFDGLVISSLNLECLCLFILSSIHYIDDGDGVNGSDASCWRLAQIGVGGDLVVQVERTQVEPGAGADTVLGNSH